MRFSVTIFLLTTVFFLNAQEGPIDFESSGHGQQWTWTVFENVTNPPLEIIANPDANGENTSETVAQFTALQAGNPWAGCETMHGADIGSFMLDETNSTVTIKVWKSVISDVGIKLVRADSWSLGETKISNTVVGEWETMTFDMSSNEGQLYDQLVVFLDFDLNGRTQDNIIYFDDISFGNGATSVEELANLNVELFPNPVQESLNISAEGMIKELEIYSIHGDRVLLDNPNQNSFQLDLSGLATGSYIVRILTVDGEAIEQFIKE